MDTRDDGIAIVGLGAILPGAPTAQAFWQRVKEGSYAITEVPPGRWDPERYFDPDPKAPDKTYSKIGGWVRDWEWDPLGWHLPIPPRVSDAMDDGQKWAVACARATLLDYGYPERPLDPERIAVIIGNALAGERHYETAFRINFPEFAEELANAPSFRALPNDVQAAIRSETHTAIGKRFPEITEDTMPGELSNVMAGRIANLFNLRGPNFTTDAACASAMAAMSAAVRGLRAGDFDAALTGGVDRNMGPYAFVKFCKIGALSATGTRPYAEGADGFVMGEGAALFLLRRLADAERDGDRIYAVVRSIGGSSDGRGKGITAPNPVGQRIAVERAWRGAGLSPETCSLVEGHGTSTAVGDVVEVESLQEAFGELAVPVGSIALGSVKSNIGHLKSAAGAAGILKAVLALHEQVLPPSINFTKPNPGIAWDRSPFRVNTELREWVPPAAGVRRAGVSAFGFGGTNFHVVLDECPERSGDGGGRRTVAVPEIPTHDVTVSSIAKAPLRGALVIGGGTAREIRDRLAVARSEAEAGRAPGPAAPAEADLRAPERLAIDYADAADLAAKAEAALRALDADGPAVWKALRARGIFRGTGPAPKVAFLYTGQGSQYANMLASLRAAEPIVRETFAEADRVMTPLLGDPLTAHVFVDPDDSTAVAAAEVDLMQTAITQPAVLATDLALTRLLAAYGIRPDMVMGHSLGEYGALVAAGALRFEHALEAVSARGREMTNISVADNGKMAAIVAPLPEIERIVAAVGGGVVIANINSNRQAVIGGGSAAVDRAVAALVEAGHQAIPLPVSHAFHTSIVAPASEPLRAALLRLELRGPSLPVVANVSGEFYPTGEDVVQQMLDLLAAQVASPVQFVKGLRTLYDAGARVFVEVGPKKALSVFAEDVLGEHGDVISLFTNHPKVGDLASFNQALCGLYAAGLGAHSAAAAPTQEPDVADDLDRLFREFLERARSLTRRGGTAVDTTDVVVTGAALGLPGTDRVFDDRNVERILRGDELIGPIPERLREAMLDKHITRLVKKENGDPTFEAIEDRADVIKLAGRAGAFDLEEEFGVPAERVAALDRSTQLAIAAGFDALRDAGIPVVPKWRVTSKGTRLPDGWVLPDEVGDDLGVVFASAFPGYDALLDEVVRYEGDRSARRELADLVELRDRLASPDEGVEALIARVHGEIASHPYMFDRRFLFKSLAMGHAQFAEIVGARGPNTQINSACASTTQAVALAEDWIRSGRCGRVVVISADDATSDHLLEWIGAGFLASGAAATDEHVEDAATPFDRRRHGMIVGMGAAALVLERADLASKRGIRPICEVVGSVSANSAFHGSRLDAHHIAGVMEQLVATAEAHRGIDRHQIAPEMVFVSHETYTPARGGSASAEVEALRAVFGADADRIVVANTKGFTGHPMGVGIEDVVAVKSLETGLVPPVPNFKEVDPELGTLNLSKGGAYPIRYALRLAAGFGSQISMSLLRAVPSPDGSRPAPDALGYERRVADRGTWEGWLAHISGDASPQLEIVQRRLRIKVASEPDATQPVVQEPEPLVEPESSISEEQIRDEVLALVAEKTGYPQDMLDLDLDMEADLGVDTVKQAEIFVTLRETYGIPRDETLKLREFPTLAHVIAFVKERAGGSVVEEQAPQPAVKHVVDPEPMTEPESSISEEQIRDEVLALVAEKTGYPQDMLDLDLDMEADLGVDTVKQAEIFVTLRETYGIPRDETLKLREFPTLAHVIAFVKERAGGSVVEEQAAQPAVKQVTIERLTEGLDAADAVLRRVPVPVLRPPIDRCKPTGGAIGPGTRVIVMADAGGTAKELARLIESRGAEALVIDDAPAAEVLVARIGEWRRAGPIAGVYWLPALDPAGDVQDLDADAWREALRVRVKLLYATMRTLVSGDPDAAPFLVAGTRLGGLHGYGPDGAADALGGAVTGFTKAYRQERNRATAKAVDAERDAPSGEVAGHLVEETLLDPGAVEIGYRDGLRWSVSVHEAPVGPAADPIGLGPSTVFVVTGAAGSIVSAIVADLAGATAATFHLLDLAPEPDPADPDLARFASDRDGLKRELFERSRTRGERPTPVTVERELAQLERGRAALDAIEAVQRAGGSVRYHQVDLTDAAAVRAVIDRITEESRAVDVVIHGAGLEVSHLLHDKEPREFDLVFDVKADGLFNVLRALGQHGPRSTVVFSSVAGRFGNAGQTDYSAANDLLCKVVATLRGSRAGGRGVAIDWTAWEGIGMASRGSIPTMMARAGIDMLPPAAGIPVVRRELVAGTDGEVVIGDALGVLVEELDRDGGIEPTRPIDAGPLVGEVSSMGLSRGLIVRTVLDPATEPFLDHHRIEGTPVLPGVMGIEAVAEAARVPLPGWRIVSIEDVAFLAPFKFYRDEPREITVEATFRADGEAVVASCRLLGTRELPGQPEPQVTVHFTGTVRLSRTPAAVPAPLEVPHGEGNGVGAPDIYAVFFHGPSYQVVDRVWIGRDHGVGHMAEALPEDLGRPGSLVAAPRMIELCFQTAAAWEIALHDRLGLPREVRRVAIGPPHVPAGRVSAVVRPDPTTEAFDADVVDEAGSLLLRVEGYRTVELPGAVDAAAARPFHDSVV